MAKLNTLIIQNLDCNFSCIILWLALLLAIFITNEILGKWINYQEVGTILLDFPEAKL